MGKTTQTYDRTEGHTNNCVENGDLNKDNLVHHNPCYQGEEQNGSVDRSLDKNISFTVIKFSNGDSPAKEWFREDLVRQGSHISEGKQNGGPNESTEQTTEGRDKFFCYKVLKQLSMHASWLSLVSRDLNLSQKMQKRGGLINTIFADGLDKYILIYILIHYCVICVSWSL